MFLLAKLTYRFVLCNNGSSVNKATLRLLFQAYFSGCLFYTHSEPRHYYSITETFRKAWWINTQPLVQILWYFMPPGHATLIYTPLSYQFTLCCMKLQKWSCTTLMWQKQVKIYFSSQGNIIPVGAIHFHLPVQQMQVYCTASQWTAASRNSQNTTDKASFC